MIWGKWSAAAAAAVVNDHELMHKSVCKA